MVNERFWFDEYFFFVILILFICLVSFYLFVEMKKVKKELKTISGKVFDKKSGKEVEGVTVYLGKIEVGTKGNAFLPSDGNKIVTKKDGLFSFYIEKENLIWIMAEKNGKKVLKPLKISENDRIIDDILIMM